MQRKKKWPQGFIPTHLSEALTADHPVYFAFCFSLRHSTSKLADIAHFILKEEIKYLTTKAKFSDDKINSEITFGFYFESQRDEIPKIYEETVRKGKSSEELIIVPVGDNQCS